MKTIIKLTLILTLCFSNVANVVKANNIDEISKMENISETVLEATNMNEESVKEDTEVNTENTELEVMNLLDNGLETRTIKEYPIYVLDILVTDSNKHDILGDLDEGATVYYNSDTNTLTLNNAHLTAANDFGNVVQITDGSADIIDMNIDIIGNNIIDGIARVGIFTFIDTTIDSSENNGVLTIGGTNYYDVQYGIWGIETVTTKNIDYNFSNGQSAYYVSGVSSARHIILDNVNLNTNHMVTEAIFAIEATILNSTLNIGDETVIESNTPTWRGLTASFLEVSNSIINITCNNNMRSSDVRLIGSSNPVQFNNVEMTLVGSIMQDTGRLTGYDFDDLTFTGGGFIEATMSHTGTYNYFKNMSIGMHSVYDGAVFLEGDTVETAIEKPITNYSNELYTYIGMPETPAEVLYDIWVKGVQVSDSNKNDILGDGSFSIKYDSETQTLTLNEALITGEVAGGNIIQIGDTTADGTNIVNINLIGKNVINGIGENGIINYDSLNITSSDAFADLSIEAEEVKNINNALFNNAEVILESTSINVSNIENGLIGNNDNTNKSYYVFDNSDLVIDDNAIMGVLGAGVDITNGSEITIGSEVAKAKPNGLLGIFADVMNVSDSKINVYANITGDTTTVALICSQSLETTNSEIDVKLTSDTNTGQLYGIFAAYFFFNLEGYTEVTLDVSSDSVTKQTYFANTHTIEDGTVIRAGDNRDVAIDVTESSIFEYGGDNYVRFGRYVEVPEPTVVPTIEPTIEPTVEPTIEPTVEPTVVPTVVPTVEPTVVPTVVPTVEPTVVPTVVPTTVPTVVPTTEPTVEPTVEATIEPTAEPEEDVIVKLDDVVLDQDDYVIDDEGNITLNDELLETLDEGVYSVTVDNGEEVIENEIIVENEVPLLASEGSYWSVFSLILTIISLLVTILYIFINKKGDGVDYTRDKMSIVMIALFTVASIMLFIITQNINDKMAIFDSYTLFFAIILGIQVIMSKVLRKYES